MASARSARAQTREAKPCGEAGGHHLVGTSLFQACAQRARALAAKGSRVGEAEGHQTCHYHRCRPPTSWSSIANAVRLPQVNCEMMK